MELPKLIFDFLRDLEANNTREWFADNRARYDEAREAFETFTADFIAAVAAIDSRVKSVSPKECIYRINRDTRFSKDKSPYKNHMCCHVTQGGRKSRMPAYYFSVEPNGSFYGGGYYCFEPDELAKVRREICNFPEDLIAALENDAFRNRLYLWDNKLKKFPKGFEVGFEGDEYLKYKSITPMVNYSDADCLSATFAERLTEDIRLTLPVNDFLYRAIFAPDEEEVDF